MRLHSKRIITNYKINQIGFQCKQGVYKNVVIHNICLIISVKSRDKSIKICVQRITCELNFQPWAVHRSSIISCKNLSWQIYLHQNSVHNCEHSVLKISFFFFIKTMSILTDSEQFCSFVYNKYLLSFGRQDNGFHRKKTRINTYLLNQFIQNFKNPIKINVTLHETLTPKGV